MKRNKAFTLIELVSVLVILAILALIVTPLVLNIIKKARTAADKRSIDAYGRSIELAVADYLLDTGSFPTTIEQLTIEYSGDTVVCSTTQLNEDSSVYLSECTVGGRSIDYTYGTDKSPTYDAYSVGDEVTYNGVDYYVIKNSKIKEPNIILLKAEPLTVEEVNTYGGVGTANNHVNMYVTNNTNDAYYQTAYNYGSYGGMAYYSSSTCNGYGDSSGCTNAYETSEVKYVVDAWKTAKAPLASEARLLKSADFEELGYEWGNATPSDIYWLKTNDVPNWIYNTSYEYWTMNPKDDALNVWQVTSYGYLNYSGGGFHVGNRMKAVRLN